MCVCLNLVNVTARLLMNYEIYLTHGSNPGCMIS